MVYAQFYVRAYKNPEHTRMPSRSLPPNGELKIHIPMSQPYEEEQQKVPQRGMHPRTLGV